MGPQEAFDQMGELLKARFREWYLALAELPQWGEAIDTQVQKYISGVQDVVLANLNWRWAHVQNLFSSVRITRSADSDL